MAVSLPMHFEELHQQALSTVKALRTAEVSLIRILQEIDACNGYRQRGFTSLTGYLIGALEFSEARAHHFITVCRKARKIPELQEALTRGTITISKAKTIASVLTPENAARWVAVARDATVRELEQEVAKELPEVPCVERVRFRSKNQVEVTLTLEASAFEVLKRVQELLKQNLGCPATLADAIKAAAEEYVERKDPVRKIARKSPESRTPKEKALLRDSGSCQFKYLDGKICGSRYWIDIHHLVPRSKGGRDELDNLVTLCRAHHQMMHDPPT